MKDELATDTIRVASITGLPDDAKLAEILIYQVCKEFIIFVIT